MLSDVKVEGAKDKLEGDGMDSWGRPRRYDPDPCSGAGRGGGGGGGDVGTERVRRGRRSNAAENADVDDDGTYILHERRRRPSRSSFDDDALSVQSDDEVIVDAAGQHGIVLPGRGVVADAAATATIPSHVAHQARHHVTSSVSSGTGTVTCCNCLLPPTP